MCRSRIAAAPFLVVASLLACTGCSRSDSSRYIPTAAVAREALTAALEAWRRGDPANSVTSYRVPIQVANSLRRPGQKLKAFDILGEVSEDGGRILQVRLRFEQPEAEEKAQFVVVGIDPIWVFRREDYDMVTHWEHPAALTMPPRPPAQPASTSVQAEGGLPK